MDKDYSVEFNITKGGLLAEMRIIPALDGMLEVNPEDLLEAVKAAGITFGVMTEAVLRMAEEKILNTWVTIAKGETPQDGADGSVKFHFSAKDPHKQLKQDASGRVNIRDLNLIENVKKGDILCSLIPPSPAKNGTSVKGEEIQARQGAPAKLPNGSNVSYSGDRSQLLATINGMVTWVDDCVNVDPSYVVNDVDASIGNIRFNGSVVVGGEIGDGYEIHAGEDITIATTVGKVVLEAGGNIKIAGGILGQEKAIITANGKIHAKFIQDAHVKSEKEIVVDDYIRNSVISAVGAIAVKNANGFITTSKVSSERWIYCNTVGQEDAGSDTELSIGHSPVLRQEQARLKEEIAYKISDFLKLQSSLSKLRSLKTTGELTHQQEILYNKILNSMETFKTTLILKNAKIIEIAEKINKTYQGNIYIEGTVHERTNIYIGMASLRVEGPRTGVHFYLKEGQIAEAEFTHVPDIKKVLEADI